MVTKSAHQALTILPAVELVIEGLDAVLFGPLLEGLADFEYPVHAGGVPGDGELLKGLFGVDAVPESGRRESNPHDQLGRCTASCGQGF
jgi:hypothetical protein